MREGVRCIDAAAVQAKSAPLGQDAQRGAIRQAARVLKEVHGIDDAAVQQLEGPQVVLQAVTHQQRVGGEQRSQPRHDVGARCGHRCQHFGGDAREAGVVVEHCVRWPHELIEHHLQPVESVIKYL